ncbi:MAG: hypothetical protein E6Q28_14680 [Afipia sp.]|nr:MAG: hypothetical protein E6Q28_14680 [Afipia sp.]
MGVCNCPLIWRPVSPFDDRLNGPRIRSMPRASSHWPA